MVQKHKFISTIGDGSDSTLLQPSDWNDTHVDTQDITYYGATPMSSGTDEAAIATINDLAIAAAIAAQPVGGTVFVPSGWWPISRPIDLTKPIRFTGTVSSGDIYSSNPDDYGSYIRAASTFSGFYLMRNWTDTESSTATPPSTAYMGNRAWPQIEKIQLHTGYVHDVTCLGLINFMQGAYVRDCVFSKKGSAYSIDHVYSVGNLVFDSGIFYECVLPYTSSHTGTLAADVTAGNWTVTTKGSNVIAMRIGNGMDGALIENCFIGDGSGWLHEVYVDPGYPAVYGANDITLNNWVGAASRATGSPFLFANCSFVRMNDSHSEATTPSGSATIDLINTGQFRAHNVLLRPHAWGTTDAPVVRATNPHASGTVDSPILDNIDFGDAMFVGIYTGNLIEDSTNSNNTQRLSSTSFPASTIIHYDGQSFDWSVMGTGMATRRRTLLHDGIANSVGWASTKPVSGGVAGDYFANITPTPYVAGWTCSAPGVWFEEGPLNGTMNLTTVQCPIIADTHIQANNPTSTFGGTSTYLQVGDESSTINNARRALLLPDFSSIPSGANIVSASLKLYQFSAGSSDTGVSWAVRLKKCLRAWSETQANWNVFSTGNSWTTAGCSDVSDCGSTDLSISMLNATTPVEWAAWSSTAALVADVQSAVNGGQPFYGWLLKSDGEYHGTTGYMQNQFYSREYTTDATKQPFVEVVYATPKTKTQVGVVNVEDYGAISSVGWNQSAAATNNVAFASALAACKYGDTLLVPGFYYVSRPINWTVPVTIAGRENSGLAAGSDTTRYGSQIRCADNFTGNYLIRRWTDVQSATATPPPINANITSVLGVISYTGHIFDNGDTVVLSNLVGGSGYTAGTFYFVVNKTSSTFQLSTTLGGIPITSGTNITAGIASDSLNVYPRIRDIELNLGKTSGVTALGLINFMQTAWVKRVLFGADSTATGCTPIRIGDGTDAGLIEDCAVYASVDNVWAHDIYVDSMDGVSGSPAGNSDLLIRNWNGGMRKTTGAPFYYANIAHVHMESCHTEATAPSGHANFELVNVNGFKASHLIIHPHSASDAPIIKATNTHGSGYEVNSPVLEDVNFLSTIETGMFTGDLIEDYSQSSNVQILSVVNCPASIIDRYDGHVFDFRQTGGTDGNTSHYRRFILHDGIANEYGFTSSVPKSGGIAGDYMENTVPTPFCTGWRCSSPGIWFAEGPNVGNYNLTTVQVPVSVDGALQYGSPGSPYYDLLSTFSIGDDNAATAEARRALLKPDLTVSRPADGSYGLFTGLGIPAGSLIVSASPVLYQIGAGSTPSGLTWQGHFHRMLHTWTEAEVTWNNFAASGTWVSAGGTAGIGGNISVPGSVNSVLANTVNSSALLLSALGNGYKAWPSSSVIVADIQGWLDNTFNNYGWLLVSNGEFSNGVNTYASNTFAAHENTTVAYRPYIEVTYAKPKFVLAT